MTPTVPPAPDATAPNEATGAPQSNVIQPSACPTPVAAAFEEFDLDDIGIIESKVFA